MARPSKSARWSQRPAARTAAGLAGALGLALVLALPAGAQTWISVGPPGGSVRSLAADPTHPGRLYLGTADGILYRSEDDGSSWERQNPGLALRGVSLDAIAVGMGALYAGYWEVDGSGGGVARSRDAGRTFTVLGGMDHESVRALAIAPSNPGVVAAGTLTGVFLTKDGGKSWKRISAKDHADLRNIESLAFDPNDARTLYAGTWHLAWKTTDAGGTWAPVHRGMIDDSDVMSLTVSPDDSRTVYASACTGVYRSREAGAGWIRLEGIPYSSRRTRAFALGDGGDLLLAGTTEGLWISEDQGGAWRRATAPELVINALLVRPNGEIVLGTEGAGVLKSSDRGRTWASGNAGFSERFVSQILWDEAGHRVFVATWGDPRFGGVFSSSDPRGPWEHLAEGLQGRQVLALAIRDGTLFAGTDDGVFSRGSGDGAWLRLTARLEEKDTHPRVTDLVAAPEALLAATREGLLRIEGPGRAWSRPSGLPAEEILALAQSPDEPRLVLAATRSGIFRSIDAGAHWTLVSTDLSGALPHRLAFVPGDSPVVLATTSSGLYRSADQGASWQRVQGGIPQCDLRGLAVDARGRTIYASDFSAGGIFRSLDGGRTWKRMPTDGLASDRVWTLGFDPSAPERVLVAPAAGGLHLLAAPVSLGTFEAPAEDGGTQMVSSP